MAVRVAQVRVTPAPRHVGRLLVELDAGLHQPGAVLVQLLDLEVESDAVVPRSLRARRLGMQADRRVAVRNAAPCVSALDRDAL